MRGKRTTSREEIWAKVAALPSSPVAFQALWDGDSIGWHVWLAAVTGDGGVHFLGIFADGGDLRIFNGQVPPWPEAAAARQVGEELAQQYGAEFYFPSPNHPEDDCPEWNDRDKGFPCRRCGILLLQREPCPWRGTCYHCHMKEEREQREAQWTPEQRNGPRCHMCGKPATGELNGAPACATCVDSYEVYHCGQCNQVITISKSIEHSTLCRMCERQNAINALTPAQRDSIRAATAKSKIQGIKAATEIMNCSLHDASFAVDVLSDEETTEEQGEIGRDSVATEGAQQSQH